MASIEEQIIAQALWELGDLRYKLKPCQQQMDADINSWPGLKYVIKCSRRIGKSFYLVSRGTSRCQRQRRAIVRYAAPTHKALKTIILPIMRKVIEDCPAHLRPRWSSGDSAYLFPNESVMYLSGVNSGHAENLRGNMTDEFILDEAGTIDDLQYLIEDIAMPQLLDMDGRIVDGRKLIISGTPPRTPAHEFTQISRQAQLEGNYSHFTIYDGGFPPEIIEIFKKEAGGEESSTWKREYLAMDVVDEDMALVPEWKESYVQEPTVDEFFPYYQKYVSLDIGVRDLTVALFGWYDFSRATLHIVEEVVLSGPSMTTERLARLVQESEARLVAMGPKCRTPVPGQGLIHKRVSDVDLLLLNDLRALHGLYFIPTDKGKLEEMVNEVRIWVNAGRIIVSPRCKQLIGCLSYGVWNENRTDFDRVPEFGHFDALASLMYLVRNVDQNMNPIPKNYGKSEDDHWIPPEDSANSNREKIRKAFNLR